LRLAQTIVHRKARGPKNGALTRDEAPDTGSDLPGLKSSSQFREALEAAFSYGVRQGNPLSVVMLEIDHFAEYNEAHGREDGDEVLSALAQVLRGEARLYDLVARFSGGEFAILLPAADVPAVLTFAERLRSAVAGLPWRHRPVTVSLGMSTMRPDHFSGGELMVAATRALDRSKRSGRDRATHANDLNDTPSTQLALRS
jgi:diguanylate cyclase (GGDEF)-like protein